MIIYEVNLIIEPQILHDFKYWLTEHVNEILNLDGFIKADMYHVLDDETKICIHYHLSSRTELDNYLEHHAPRLRADGLERFGTQFSATRRFLVVTKT